LTRLQYLDLRNNEVNKVPNTINNLLELRDLYLASNQIRDLPKNVYTLENLRVLDVEGNQIKNISNDIDQLLRLNNLYLGYNQIRKLPEELIRLTSLRQVSLDANPIKKREVRQLKRALPQTKMTFDLGGKPKR